MSTILRGLQLLLLGMLLNGCAFLHVNTPVGPVNVGGVITPDGRVGVSAGTRVGNVVIGGVSKTVDILHRKGAPASDEVQAGHADDSEKENN